VRTLRTHARQRPKERVMRAGYRNESLMRGTRGSMRGHRIRWCNAIRSCSARSGIRVRFGEKNLRFKQLDFCKRCVVNPAGTPRFFARFGKIKHRRIVSSENHTRLNHVMASKPNMHTDLAHLWLQPQFCLPTWSFERANERRRAPGPIPLPPHPAPAAVLTKLIHPDHHRFMVSSPPTGRVDRPTVQEPMNRSSGTPICPRVTRSGRGALRGGGYSM
jgi:hypothetical protein